MRVITLDLLIKQMRGAVKPWSNSQKRNLLMASQCLEAWGDVAIPEEKESRHAVAESIAHRLAKPPGFVKDRLDKLSRSANYDQEGNNRTLEEPHSPV